MPRKFMAACVLVAAMAFGASATAHNQTGGASPSTAGEPKAKKSHKAKRSQRVQVPRVLRRIAECESGGNPRAVSPDGLYRGKYQFSRPTWRSVGGRGDPAAAREREQDRRAIQLYRAQGTAPWPSCG